MRTPITVHAAAFAASAILVVAAFLPVLTAGARIFG